MHNVRRYVALAQSRGGACFCTRGAMQGYAVITLFSRWQKPWHRREPPAAAGAACAARALNVPLYQKVLAAQKAMPYTDLLGTVAAF